MKYVDAGAAMASLFELDTDIQAAMGKALKGAVKDGEDSARSTPLFNDVTGATRASVRGSVNELALTGTIRAGKAAMFLENGTKAHEIRPRNGSVLRFQINGQWVSAKSVQHPGTQPRPFMSEAAKVAERSLDYYAEMFIDQVIK